MTPEQVEGLFKPITGSSATGLAERIANRPLSLFVPVGLDEEVERFQGAGKFRMQPELGLTHQVGADVWGVSVKGTKLVESGGREVVRPNQDGLIVLQTQEGLLACCVDGVSLGMGEVGLAIFSRALKQEARKRHGGVDNYLKAVYARAADRIAKAGMFVHEDTKYLSQINMAGVVISENGIDAFRFGDTQLRFGFRDDDDRLVEIDQLTKRLGFGELARDENGRRVNPLFQFPASYIARRSEGINQEMYPQASGKSWSWSKIEAFLGPLGKDKGDLVIELFTDGLSDVGADLDNLTVSDRQAYRDHLVRFMDEESADERVAMLERARSEIGSLKASPRRVEQVLKRLKSVRDFSTSMDDVTIARLSGISFGGEEVPDSEKITARAVGAGRSAEDIYGWLARMVDISTDEKMSEQFGHFSGLGNFERGVFTGMLKIYRDSHEGDFSLPLLNLEQLAASVRISLLVSRAFELTDVFKEDFHGDGWGNSLVVFEIGKALLVIGSINARQGNQEGTGDFWLVGAANGGDQKGRDLLERRLKALQNEKVRGELTGRDSGRLGYYLATGLGAGAGGIRSANLLNSPIVGLNFRASSKFHRAGSQVFDSLPDRQPIVRVEEAFTDPSFGVFEDDPGGPKPGAELPGQDI